MKSILVNLKWYNLPRFVRGVILRLRFPVSENDTSEMLVFNQSSCLFTREVVCYTPPKFNIAPEKDGWKTTFLLGWPIFRGELLVLGRV